MGLGQEILRHIMQDREWLELGKVYNRRALDWRERQSQGLETRLDQTVCFLSWFTVLVSRKKCFLEQVTKLGFFSTPTTIFCTDCRKCAHPEFFSTLTQNYVSYCFHSQNVYTLYWQNSVEMKTILTLDIPDFSAMLVKCLWCLKSPHFYSMLSLLCHLR